MENASTTHGETGVASAAAPLPTRAQEEWARCRRYIERAIAEGPGFNTIEDIEREVEARRQIFWAHPNGAAITRIDQYAGFRVLTVAYAAGDLADSEMIAAFLPDLENFARIAECSHVAVETQPNRAALFTEAGFSPLYLAFAKPVIPQDALDEMALPLADAEMAPETAGAT